MFNEEVKALLQRLKLDRGKESSIMPLPTPNGQPKDEFVSSCMANDTMKEEFPDKGQRLAVCNSQYKAKGFEEQDIVHAISTMLPGTNYRRTSSISRPEPITSRQPRTGSPQS